MTKLLIAVKSCHEHRLARYNQTIRETWGRDVKTPALLRFFHGSPVRSDTAPLCQLQEDEVVLHVQDNYDSLPYKTREILKFFLGHPVDFDNIFLCDTDTFALPRRLVNCGFEKYDVAGRFGSHPEIGTTFHHVDDRRNRIDNCHPWPSGGVGYFLSRKAARIVVDTEPMTWAEDLYVGQATGPFIQTGELKAADLPDFEAQTAWHFQRKQYNNEVYNLKFGWMDKLYQENYVR